MKLPEKEKLEELRKAHGLKLILLHGSQVIGKTHSQSDIDIAVLRQDPKKPLDTITLISELISLFHNNTIDVSDLTLASPLLLYNATQNSLLLSGSLSNYNKLKLRAFHSFNNYSKYFEIESEFIREKVNKYGSI